MKTQTWKPVNVLAGRRCRAPVILRTSGSSTPPWWLGVLAVCLFTFNTHAQSYTIDWYKIAGGGGTSTNGSYSANGTIGQPDASGAMTGGGYSMTGDIGA